MQNLALRVGKLTKQKFSGVWTVYWTVHKYFSHLNITNSDPTKQATPYEFRYNIQSWISTTFIYTIIWKEYNWRLTNEVLAAHNN